MPELDKVLCEVCGKPVDLLIDYADALSGQVYSPREYYEHQLTMSEEEKVARTTFFEEMFRQHEERKAAKSEHNTPSS